MDLKQKHQKFDSEQAKQGIITGYASVFGNKDSDGDVMEKGAYKKTLQENKERVKFLWQHKMDSPLGKVNEVYEDDKGLFFEAKISDTALGKDAKALIADGVLNEFSVGFMPIKYETRRTSEGGYEGLDIKEVKLYEFSLVTLAANDQALMSEFKSAEETYESLTEKFDSIINLNKRIKSDDARFMVEYELRKFKELLSSLELSIEDHREEQQVKEEMEILNAFDKIVNDFEL